MDSPVRKPKGRKSPSPGQIAAGVIAAAILAAALFSVFLKKSPESYRRMEFGDPLAAGDSFGRRAAGSRSRGDSMGLVRQNRAFGSRRNAAAPRRSGSRSSVSESDWPSEPEGTGGAGSSGGRKTLGKKKLKLGTKGSMGTGGSPRSPAVESRIPAVESDPKTNPAGARTRRTASSRKLLGQAGRGHRGVSRATGKTAAGTHAASGGGGSGYQTGDSPPAIGGDPGDGTITGEGLSGEGDGTEIGEGGTQDPSLSSTGGGSMGGGGGEEEGSGDPCSLDGNTRCGAFTCAVEKFGPAEAKIHSAVRRQFETNRYIMKMAKEDADRVLKKEDKLLRKAGQLKSSLCQPVSKAADDIHIELTELINAIKEEKDLIDTAMPICKDTLQGGNLQHDPCPDNALTALQKELLISDSLKAFVARNAPSETVCNGSGEECTDEIVADCKKLVRDHKKTQKAVYYDQKVPDLKNPWCGRFPGQSGIGLGPVDMWCHACRCVLGRIRTSRKLLKDFLPYAEEFQREIPGMASGIRKARGDIRQALKLLGNTLKDSPSGNRNQSFFQGTAKLQSALRILTPIAERLEAKQKAACK